MFEAAEVARALVEAVAPLVRKIQRYDPVLADQLRRCSSAVMLNTSEGGCRRGKDRCQSFRVARGEAAETTAALSIALTYEYISLDETQPALDLADRSRAMLWRMGGH